MFFWKAVRCKCTLFRWNGNPWPTVSASLLSSSPHLTAFLWHPHLGKLSRTFSRKNRWGHLDPDTHVKTGHRSFHPRPVSKWSVEKAGCWGYKSYFHFSWVNEMNCWIIWCYGFSVSLNSSHIGSLMPRIARWQVYLQVIGLTEGNLIFWGTALRRD